MLTDSLRHGETAWALAQIGKGFLEVQWTWVMDCGGDTGFEQLSPELVAILGQD